jgi:hypothetical protein
LQSCYYKHKQIRLYMVISVERKYLSRFELINTFVLVYSEYLLERERERERERRRCITKQVYYQNFTRARARGKECNNPLFNITKCGIVFRKNHFEISSYNTCSAQNSSVHEPGNRSRRNHLRPHKIHPI